MPDPLAPPFPPELARFDPDAETCLWCSANHRHDLEATLARQHFVEARAAYLRRELTDADRPRGSRSS